MFGGNQFEMTGGVWRRRRNVGLGIGRLALIACASGFAAWSLFHKDPVSESVQLVAAELRDVPVWAHGVGHVQPGQAVTVRVQAPGQLKRVLFAEGQEVKKGDLLAVIDPSLYQAQLEQAKANKAQDEAQLAAAQQELKNLAKAKASPENPRVAALKQAARQFEAAIKSDQAAITTASAMLERTQVVAPIDGRVGLRRVDEGNMVNPDDANGLVEITQMQPVAVVFSMGEQVLPQISQRMAQQQPLAVQAVDAAGEQPLAQGVLSMADSQVDAASGSVRLKAVFDNADRTLWPGAAVNVRMQLGLLPGSVVVPASAVLRSGPRNYVYVADAGGNTIAMREVTLKLTTDDHAVVQSGLNPGEQVVASTTPHLRDGLRITQSKTSVAAAGAAAATLAPAR
ncbi:MAG: efflux RND transporter periplasmic adaptor subunit [Proteobacteria bacterium]|nr:efflux RND transporter periplasmic adaptor subunit [Pseudomonadota bacterium]